MGLLGMKGNHNFVPGLIWRHERRQMKSLSKPPLILFIACRSLRNLPPHPTPWCLWFDSPVVLDLVPPWYLWHVDIKWLPRQAAAVFQSPLSDGYSVLVWTGKKRCWQTDIHSYNHMRGRAAAICRESREVNIVHSWPLWCVKTPPSLVVFWCPCQTFFVHATSASWMSFILSRNF